MKTLRSSLWACVLLPLFACGNGPAGGGDAATGGDAAAEGGDGGSASIAGGQACPGVTNPTSCPVGNVAACGACVPLAEDPANDRLRRTPCSELEMDKQDYCDRSATAAPPNLSCFTGFNPASPPTPAASMNVTVWGVVDVFGTGGDADEITVQVFRVNPDGTPGAMVGQAIARTSVYNEIARRENGGSGVMMRRLGGFKIDNVPTETALVVKTVGTTGFSHPIYDYTLPVRNSLLAMPPAAAATALSITGPAVRIRPRTIADGDWITIPSTATLPTGIRMGNGAIAGEVHDCDDVRLSNAMVYSSPAPQFEGTVYFSNNASNPLPDTSRATHGTQLLGLYALLDARPGATRITAVGYDPMGTPTMIGTLNVQVFANAVTVATFRGNPALNP